MEPDTQNKTRIAALQEEMDGIHFVNTLYWGRGEAVTSEARAEYQRRQDRLEEIHAELAQLRLASLPQELQQQEGREEAPGGKHK